MSTSAVKTLQSMIALPTVTVRTMSVFAQRLNALTGRCEWVEQTDDYDFHQEVARSAFADMLHDTDRNQKYELALKRAIELIHDAGRKANVLDIGTGTGLLSMMAARNGADTITACEAFSPIAKCAQQIVQQNGFANKITVVSKRSTELCVGENGDMKELANILVTEVFDTELIGEGALSTFRDAHNRLLEKDCFVIPDSGTVYAQVVESPLVTNWNTLKALADEDGDILIDIPDTVRMCSGTQAVHDVQLSQLSCDQFKALSMPLPVLKFDWSGKTDLPLHNMSTVPTKALTSGTAQAVFMWWDLNMDAENKIILSCAPFWAHPDKLKQPLEHIPWRDHWMQAVYFLPNPIFIAKDQQFSVVSTHDEYSLWFDVTIQELQGPFVPTGCTCGVHYVNSRTRIGQLNDSIRNKKYIRALSETLTPDSVCLSLNDASLICLSSVKINAKHLFCIETNIASQQMLQLFINHNKLGDKVTVYRSLDDFKKSSKIKDVTHIISEPNFVSSILPWDNARFSYLKGELRGLLREDVITLPQGGTVYAMPVQYNDLHKIRAPLDKCEGFEMGAFDHLIEDSSGKTDCPVEPQPLWEYPCICLGPPKALLEMDFTKDLIQIEAHSGKLSFEVSGTCNGVALWVDWNLNGNPRNIVTTGPVREPTPGEKVQWDMYTRQGVYLIPRPLVVNESHTLKYNVCCDIEKGDLAFQFDIEDN